MRALSRGDDVPNQDEDPAVAAAVRLLLARRGWAYSMITSLLAVLGYAVAGIWILDGVTGGTTGPFGAIIRVAALGLLVLAVSSLLAVVICTVMLRGRDDSVRAQAASQVKPAGRRPGAPRQARASRDPRNWRVRTFVCALLALWALIVTGFLPQQVNAIAYVAGSGPSAMFTGRDHRQDCSSRGGCVTVTDGTLLTSPPAAAVWPGRAALGRPFPVRRPAWAGWGSPLQLMNGLTAGLMLGFGVFLDIISAGVVIGLTIAVRRRWRPA